MILVITTLLSLKCIYVGRLKWKHSRYSISYLILLYKVYRDPGKFKGIAGSVLSTTPIALIFTRYCLLSTFY